MFRTTRWSILSIGDLCITGSNYSVYLSETYRITIRRRVTLSNNLRRQEFNNLFIADYDIRSLWPGPELKKQYERAIYRNKV